MSAVLIFILDAVSAEHDINAYINLLSRDGNITLVGAPEKLSVTPFSYHGPPQSLRFAHRRYQRDQEMLDFCGENNITSMLKSYQYRRSMRPTRDCSIRCEVPVLDRYGFSEN